MSESNTNDVEVILSPIQDFNIDKINLVSFDIETVPKFPIEHFSPKIQKYLINRGKQFDDEDEGIAYRRFACTHPDLCKVVCISFAIGHNEKSKPEERVAYSKSIYGTDEKEVIDTFFNFIKDHKGRFVSFSGYSFDVPVLRRKSVFYGHSVKSIPFFEFRRYTEFPHLDLLPKLYDWDYSRYISMQTLLEALELHNHKDDVSGEDVSTMYDEGKLDEIAEYCENDTVANLNIYYKVMYNLSPFKKVVRCVKS